MKTVKEDRGIFTVTRQVPENDADFAALLMQLEYESPRSRMSENLQRARSIHKSWKYGGGKPGSDEMIREIRTYERFLSRELEKPIGSDPWRAADYAMALGRWWRDLEANESLMQSIDYALETKKQRNNAAAAANAKRKAEADKQAIAKFSSWQRRTRVVLVDAKKRPITAEARVKKYTMTQRLKDLEVRRIRRLLKEGRIPPL